MFRQLKKYRNISLAVTKLFYMKRFKILCIRLFHFQHVTNSENVKNITEKHKQLRNY